MERDPKSVYWRGSLVYATLACLLSIAAEGQSPSTKVHLDPSTFRSGDYGPLQQLADQVALQIDQLIPGQVYEFVRGPILCYQVHENETDSEREIGAPVTISANFRYSHESPSVVPGTTRIALFGIDPLREQRFVYQLAHELAHVKMGVRVDSYLIETFAVAAALEVERRMNMEQYDTSEISSAVERLPAPVQILYAQRDFAGLRRYWQEQVAHQDILLNDRPFQTLGAILIRSNSVPWPALLGIAIKSASCPLDNPPTNFSRCPPDLHQMLRMRSSLEALGYVLPPEPPSKSPGHGVNL